MTAKIVFLTSKHDSQYSNPQTGDERLGVMLNIRIHDH